MRKPRKLSAKVIYHVCARANRQELILEDEQIKMMLLDVISQAKKKYNFLFRNFCIMGNHIHLEIEPCGDISLSKIMQWILSVFAIRYNRLFKYKGHVWYDRFKSKIIESFQQLINTFLYIANNPVRAELVMHPLDFKYSGLHFYERGAPPGYRNLLDPIHKGLKPVITDHLAGYDIEIHKKADVLLSFQAKR